MSVLVYTENRDGKFKKASFELVSYATKLAEMMNTTATVLSIGNVEHAELETLGSYGAKKIISVVDDHLQVLDNRTWTKAIAEVAEKENADVLVLSDNNTGKALAPRLAARLKAGIGSGVGRLPLSIEPFLVHKRAYSGNAYAKVQINSAIKIITLAQNSFDLVETPSDVDIKTYSPAMDDADINTKVIDVQKKSGKLLLSDAEVVVSGGRGMKSPDNWELLTKLADLLGGAVACTRPVSDEGWRPHDEHTGQTGKIIAPNLYFAIGISGATQHLAGVNGSKYIVAINTDKDAPIFEAANYGIVGDAVKVLPGLIAAVEEVTS